jgi:hypothetical protein
MLRKYSTIIAAVIQTNTTLQSIRKHLVFKKLFIKTKMLPNIPLYISVYRN